jgi:hypothetical protein
MNSTTQDFASQDAAIMSEPSHYYYPLTRDELFSRFDTSSSGSKHLLILYSLVVGLNAKIIAEIGLGQTTGALRAAAALTGATVHTCDFDKRRHEHLLAQQDEHWRLYLEPSTSFIARLPEPLDLVLHDGAHDYSTVAQDLRLFLPKMRQFGLICVHDTQETELYRDMLAALKDGVAGFSVSITNLPFSCGLAIIRVESSLHPPITPSAGSLRDGRPDTTLVEFPCLPSSEDFKVAPVRGRLVAAKIKLGHMLRQAGLRS